MIVISSRIACFTAIVVMFLFASPIDAADIVVDETCSLADAIAAANTDESVGGCPAGDGADVIRLTANVTLSERLPRITTDITVEGGGYSVNGAFAHRIFFIDASGTLAIRQLTLQNGRASEVRLPTEVSVEAGGAVFNYGVLSIAESSFANNTAENGGAIFSWGETSISDSVFSDNSADQDGGAIYNTWDLKISNGDFSGNQAGDDGGAIANLYKLSINGGSFTGNSADQNGGAAYNFGRLKINGSSISDNSADAGGAIYNARDGELSVIGSAISGNSAYYRGGAIYNLEKMSVRGSEFSGNTASLGGAIHSEKDLNIDGSAFADNAAHIGGAINNLGELNLSGSTFRGNKAGTGGALNNSAIDSPGRARVVGSVFTGNLANAGGALSNDAELSLMESEISRNTALIGAGIANIGILSVSNSTIAANSGEYEDSADSDEDIVSMGGGIFIFSQEGHRTDVVLTHVTLARNSADVGGGINIVDSPYAIVSLRNSINADNSGGDCVGALSSSAFNLIKDGSCDAEFGGDPMLGDLVEPDDGSPAYFPLLAGSPAIDAANSDFCPDSDQIGTVRPLGDGCDIGAIEYVPEN